MISVIGKPIRHPKRHITPNLDGLSKHDSEVDLSDAGYIYAPDSPTFTGNKIIHSIHFCNDDKNIYLRFEFNKENIKERPMLLNQIFIYFRNQNNETYSPIRLTNKTDTIVPILTNLFSSEVMFVFDKKEVYIPVVSESAANGLWTMKPQKKIKYAYQDVMSAAISFEDLGVNPGENVEFCIILGNSGIIREIFPQDILLKLTNI